MLTIAGTARLSPTCTCGRERPGPDAALRHLPCRHRRFQCRHAVHPRRPVRILDRRRRPDRSLQRRCLRPAARHGRHGNAHLLHGRQPRLPDRRALCRRRRMSGCCRRAAKVGAGGRRSCCCTATRYAPTTCPTRSSGAWCDQGVAARFPRPPAGRTPRRSRDPAQAQREGHAGQDARDHGCQSRRDPRSAAATAARG
jgi:hypothetical protein